MRSAVLIAEINDQGNILKALINGILSNLKAWGNTKKCSSVIYVISKSN